MRVRQKGAIALVVVGLVVGACGSSGDSSLSGAAVDKTKQTTTTTTRVTAPPPVVGAVPMGHAYSYTLAYGHLDPPADSKAAKATPPPPPGDVYSNNYGLLTAMSASSPLAADVTVNPGQPGSAAQQVVGVIGTFDRDKRPKLTDSSAMTLVVRMTQANAGRLAVGAAVQFALDLETHRMSSPGYQSNEFYDYSRGLVMGQSVLKGTIADVQSAPTYQADKFPGSEVEVTLTITPAAVEQSYSLLDNYGNYSFAYRWSSL